MWSPPISMWESSKVFAGELVPLDVRSTDAVRALAARIGPIDILFDCAGYVHHGTVLECSEAVAE